MPVLTPGPTRYKAIGLFKQGKFSEVSFLTELASGKDLVGRLLYPHAGSELVLLQGLDRTAAALRTLQHPHLPCFDKLVEGTAGTWMLFHYESGTPLAHYFTLEQTISDAWIVWWLHELLTALHALHTHDPPFVVGYIEPSDVIVEGHRLWLCDLGLLEDIFPELGATLLLRHPFADFIAPERRVSAQTTPSGDLFSVGAVGFWLATGHSPTVSAHRSGEDLAQAVREHRPHLPESVVELLIQLLSFSPQQRPPSAAQALEHLAPHVRTMQGEVPPPAQERPLYKHLAVATQQMDLEAVASTGSLAPPPPIFQERGAPPAPVEISPWQEFVEDVWWQARRRPAALGAAGLVLLAVLWAALAALTRPPQAPPPPPLFAVKSGRVLIRLPHQEAWRPATGAPPGGQVLAGPQGASLSFGHGELQLGPQALLVVDSPGQVRLSGGRLHARLGSGDSLTVVIGTSQAELAGDSDVTLDLGARTMASQRGTATFRNADRAEKVTAGTAIPLPLR